MFSFFYFLAFQSLFVLLSGSHSFLGKKFMTHKKNSWPIFNKISGKNSRPKIYLIMVVCKVPWTLPKAGLPTPFEKNEEFSHKKWGIFTKNEESPPHSDPPPKNSSDLGHFKIGPNYFFQNKTKNLKEKNSYGGLPSCPTHLIHTWFEGHNH